MPFISTAGVPKSRLGTKYRTKYNCTKACLDYLAPPQITSNYIAKGTTMIIKSSTQQADKIFLNSFHAIESNDQWQERDVLAAGVKLYTVEINL